MMLASRTHSVMLKRFYQSSKELSQNMSTRIWLTTTSYFGLDFAFPYYLQRFVNSSSYGYIGECSSTPHSGISSRCRWESCNFFILGWIKKNTCVLSWKRLPIPFHYYDDVDHFQLDTFCNVGNVLPIIQRAFSKRWVAVISPWLLEATGEF